MNSLRLDLPLETYNHNPYHGRLAASRALEALRAGVPNAESVLTLGSMQEKVTNAFRENLTSMTDEDREKSVGGILIGGGFGSGKSHLLEALAQRALHDGFVVSKIVISKETPFHNIAAMFKAAINDARVPGRPGMAVNVIAHSIDVNSAPYAKLYRWLHTDGRFIDHRLTASLRLFEQYSSGDEDFADRLTQFWAGDNFPIPEFRKRLKEAGWLSDYEIKASKEQDLCRDRFSFFSRLIRAAGYHGWVILIDELELIGRYSMLQRARSYAEVARWLDGSKKDFNAPITSVLTTVDDFESEVLISRNDYDKIPAKLLTSDKHEQIKIVDEAKRGMKYLARNQLQLDTPNDTELDRTYEAIKAIHAEALQWQPPDVEGIERLPSNRMRQYVRSWINEWDLLNLDPYFKPVTIATPLEIEFSEDAEIEGHVELF